MREDESGAVASVPVDEQPTAAADLLIILVSYIAGERKQDSAHGIMAAFLAGLRRVVFHHRAARTHR